MRRKYRVDWDPTEANQHDIPGTCQIVSALTGVGEYDWAGIETKLRRRC